jgi:hypothetical protein
MNDKSEATRAAKNGNNYTKTVNKVACKKRKNAVWSKALKRMKSSKKSLTRPRISKDSQLFAVPQSRADQRARSL